MRVKIAYLLLVHDNPRLLERTVLALNSPNAAFFIHVDKKADMSQFSHIAGENVFFIEERVAVYWGQYSQVEAILKMMQRAVEADAGYDYFVLISGTDYPLRSADYIGRFLEDQFGSEFMSCVRMPNEAAGKPLSRINTLVLPSSQPVRRFVVRVLAKLGWAKRDYRKHLGNLAPYSGSTWWGLTRGACQYILQFVRDNPKVTAYFRYTFASDESLLHTILGNSRFQPQIKRNFTYDDWHARGASPESIGERHIELFKSKEEVVLDDVYGRGEALFARKFCDSRLELTASVDRMILEKDKNKSEAEPKGSEDVSTSGSSRF